MMIDIKSSVEFFFITGKHEMLPEV